MKIVSNALSTGAAGGSGVSHSDSSEPIRALAKSVFQQNRCPEASSKRKSEVFGHGYDETFSIDCRHPQRPANYCVDNNFTKDSQLDGGGDCLLAKPQAPITHMQLSSCTVVVAACGGLLSLSQIPVFPTCSGL